MCKNMIVLFCCIAYIVSVNTSMRQIVSTTNVETESSKARRNLMTGLLEHNFDLVKQEISRNYEVLLKYKKIIFLPNTTLPSEGLCMAPIHELVASDNVCALEFLLRQPESIAAEVVNQRTMETLYPPMYFAHSKAAMKLLVQHRASVQAKSRDERPLIEMILFRQPQQPSWAIAHFLLKKGRCDINAFIDLDQNTLLHKAVIEGLSSIITFLLKRGASPELNNKWGISPWQLAISRHRVEITTIIRLHLLCKQLDNDAVLNLGLIKDDQDNTWLHNAVVQQDHKEIERLIHSNIDLIAKNKQGLTAFQMLMQSQNRQCIEAFKKTFAYVFLNTDSYMPEYRNRKNFLINHLGINTSTGPDDTTLLHMAVVNNNYDKCVMLLKHGANVNVEGKQMSPLFTALSQKYFSIASLLLDAGATVIENFLSWDLANHISVKMEEKYEKTRNNATCF